MAEILKVPPKGEASLDWLNKPFRRAPPKAKPKLELEVSPQMAEAVKANPESLRVIAKATNNTTLVERPTAVERMLAERFAQARAMQDAEWEKAKPEVQENVGTPWQGEDGVRRAMVEMYRRPDPQTGEPGSRTVGVVEFPGGYRRPAGAQHEYDPLDALKRD